VIRSGFTPKPSTQGMLDSVKAGLTFILKKPEMGSLIAVSFLMTFLGIPIVVYLPVFAKTVFRGDVGMFTLLQTVEGVGAILGAFLIAARGKKMNLGRDAVIGLTSLGLLMGAFALTPNLVVACVFLFFGGVALITCFGLVSSLVQFAATDEMRGRVMSIYNIAFRGGMPVGSFLTGGLVDRVGAPAVVSTMGGMLAVMGLYLFFVNKKVAQL